MLTKNEKNSVDYAVKLAKAVRMVTDALTVNFVEWKNVSCVDKEIIKNMEKTHQLVIDYIHGILGGNMNEIVNQIIKRKQS